MRALTRRPAVEGLEMQVIAMVLLTRIDLDPDLFAGTFGALRCYSGENVLGAPPTLGVSRLIPGTNRLLAPVEVIEVRRNRLTYERLRRGARSSRGFLETRLKRSR